MKNSVVIADIGGQALDILPQCAQSAQKKIMVEIYIHSHIQPHIQTENIKMAKNENSPHLMDGDGTYKMLHTCSTSRDA